MKLGSYIHFGYHNYLANGDRAKGGSNPQILSIVQAHQAALKKVLPAKNQQEKERIKSYLEEQLNFFFAPGNKVLELGYSVEDAEKIQQMILQVFDSIISQLGLNVGNTTINYSNLSARGGGIKLNSGEYIDFMRERKNKLGGKTGYRTTYSAIARRMESLITKRNSLLGATEGIDKEFVDKVNELEEEYSKLFKDIQSNLDKYGGIQTGFHKKGNVDTSNARGIFKMNEAQKNFVDKMQNAIDLTKQVTNDAIAGALGEYIPAITQYVYQQLEDEKIDELLNNFENNFDCFIGEISGEVKKKVVGQKTSRKALLKNKVSSKKDNNHATDAQIADVPIRTNYTQDKVDVELELPDHQKINASMKNVNLFAGNIKVLTGTSTLNFLQDYPGFGNYYLNVTANNGRFSNDSAPASEIQRAHDLAKLTIALHALIGGVWGEDKETGLIGKTPAAEILVVNNTAGKTGNFKIYFMSDLLDKIEKNLDLVKIEGWDGVRTYDNTWLRPYSPNINSALARSAQVLAQLHTEQLKVSISPKTLI